LYRSSLVRWSPCLGGFGIFLVLGAFSSLARAAGEPVLQAAGPIAAAEQTLLAEAVALMLFVVVPVIVLTPWVAWRYRRRNRDSSYRPKWSFSWLLEVLIWGGPAVVVALLGYKVWVQSQALDPYRPVSPTRTPLEVEVVGLDWKWLFIYPQQHVATINALAFPVGRPVHLRLTSDTVMQSLLMPQLAGQIYAMPGMTTQLSFQADRPGDYLGENTQYNGRGFARQSFTAQAMSAQAFARWTNTVRQRGTPLDAPRYAQVSARSIPAKPLYFSNVEAGLFDRLVAKYHRGAQAPTAGAVLQPLPERAPVPSIEQEHPHEH
jgi:cytochrome o ubiquinol oxidase subunit II